METTSNNRVRCLFGTDGVRDIANRGMMTPEMALRLGRSYVLFLTERGTPRPKIVVGRDTRRSGEMLEAALAAGMTSAGAEVLSVGITPTPAVSFGIQYLGADGGAVISASHNPAEYNGIKFLNAKGLKLSDDDELSIEEYLEDNLIDDWRPSGASIGEIRKISAFNQIYADRIISMTEGFDLAGLDLVVDCAHGAASSVIPHIRSKTKAKWEIIGASPNGLNINEGVGVMHMSHLSKCIKEGSSGRVGLSYDGDADRVLLMDSQGRVIDGDIMIWVIARWLAERGKLGSGVVATVMSNLALDDHLSQTGLQLYRCPVGDRYVMQTMRAKTSFLGGEQSGHVILREYVQTGDGLCTGFAFLRACACLGEDIDSLIDRFGRYPQLLRNLSVKNKSAIMNDESLKQALSAASERMGKEGRVFLRPSGTEPLVRLLVECRDGDLLNKIADNLVLKIKDIAEK